MADTDKPACIDVFYDLPDGWVRIDFYPNPLDLNVQITPATDMKGTVESNLPLIAMRSMHDAKENANDT